MTGSADDIRMIVSWFPTAMPEGPAYGGPETIRWADFASVLDYRREGVKDGPCLVPARFQLEPNGRRVRRLKRGLVERTAIALDVETSKETGEIPPDLDVAVARVAAMGWAAACYTSHSHTPANIRYRIILPLSEPVDHELPAVEVVAEALGVLGVLDTSKVGASSVFYLPSCPCGALDGHQTVTVTGSPVDAGWLRERAGALLAARQAEADAIADQAHREAAERRAAKIAAGLDPDASLIEKLRSHLDLAGILTSHAYAKAGTKYRHPNSESGSYGADIKSFAGVERVFSHNGTDPLHASNLPDWCGTVTALDAFDVVTILGFGGDRNRAMRELALRFGLSKPSERKALAALIFRLIRHRRPQAEIESAAVAEGERQGLTPQEILAVSQWVVANREAA